MTLEHKKQLWGFIAGPVFYSKEESVRKVKAHLDIEALQQDINILKILYKKQERSQENYEKSI